MSQPQPVSVDVSKDVQTKLVDEVLSASRKYNLSGRAKVRVILDAKTGEVVWSGRLDAGEYPAYDHDGVNIGLSARDSFASRDFLCQQLRQEQSSNPHINLD